jgi:hypothetical protein
MRESTIERALARGVKRQGGVARKFVSPGRRGVADRLVLLPLGRAIFVELKAPLKKAKDYQSREHKRMRKLGFDVYVIDSHEGLDEFLNAEC